MTRSTWCLLAGASATVAAFLPPFHELAPDLFSAHMVQHLVLVLLAAPLLAMGAPRAPHLGPLTVWLLHTGAMWAWHLPASYDAAMSSSLLHGVEHISFLGTGLLFWMFVIRRSGVTALQRVGLTFATALQSGALGALLAFATRPLYDSHLGRTATWGLTALEDQQLAGAIMWVPPGIVYLVVMLVLLYRWFTGLDREPGALHPLGGGSS